MKTTTRYNVYYNDKKVIENEDIKTALYWIKLFDWNVIKLEFEEIKQSQTTKFLTQINPN
jgi:hypothetical protein